MIIPQYAEDVTKDGSVRKNDSFDFKYTISQPYIHSQDKTPSKLWVYNFALSFLRGWFIKMKLEEVTKIKETTDQNEVNEFLAKGYKILKIISSKTSTPLGEEIRPIYILGLKKERGEE